MFLNSEHITKIRGLQASDQKVVFTNGCFDILHAGHVDYLTAASELGDYLVVAVNSDDSVRRLEKGTGRPVNDELNRLKLIASLKCVSSAFIFDEDTPLECISLIQPEILVKGADYDPEETDPNSKTYIVGSKEVLTYGGQVSVVELTEGFSTTKLIERIKKAY
ncbi:MAG: adenylyltransferase/cytidyltransferase family protein [Flavobacteriales bacterium]